MSFAPPKPIWIAAGSATAVTAINADGFSGYAGLSGLVEVPESGNYELAWGYKLRMILEGTVGQVLSNGNAGYFSRGYIYNGWVINDSKIYAMPGAKRRVEINWQSIDSYLPPDEWQVTTEDQQPPIERHPMFNSLVFPGDYTAARNAFLSASVGQTATAMNQIAATTNPTLVLKLVNLKLGGMEHYYLSAARYCWSSYYLPGDVPTLSQGGITYSAPSGPSGYSLPPGYSWLRYADNLGQSQYSPLGGVVKLTRTFIGGPNLFWDPDVYPAA